LQLVRFYEFDDFRLDVVRRVLLRGGELVPLPSKVFQLLLVLLENSGREIKKHELMHLLWPDTVVEESNLTQTVFLLRKALGKTRPEDSLIVTIPGSGYRFTGDARRTESSASSPNSWAPVIAPTVNQAAGTVQFLAVLPFHVVGRKRGVEYLAVGLADAVIGRLSNIEQIRVLPTSAILEHYDSESTPGAQARKLGADFVFTGKLQKIRHNMRVGVQLMDARDGRVLWKADFEDSNMQSVLESICNNALKALSLGVSDQEHRRLLKRGTEHHDAYNAYLKGRYYSYKWTQPNLTRSIEWFNAAIKYDPKFALAYSGLADSYYIISNLYIPPHQVMPKAKIAAGKALALDDTLAEAHTSLALTLAFYDWDWSKAEIEFRQAIYLNPFYAPSRLWHGRFLAARKKFDEALEELKAGQRLDPLSLSLNAELGRVLFWKREYRSATQQLQETLDLDSNFWPAHLFLGWVHEQQGHYTEALALFQRATLLDDNPRIMASLGHAYALSGDTAQAEQILKLLIRQSAKRYVAPYNIAVIYAGLGKTNDAFRWFESAFKGRSEWLAWLNVDPALDPIRADSRFKHLVHRVGLP